MSAALKSIILSAPPVRRLLEHGECVVFAPLDPQPEQLWADCYGPRDGELKIVPYHEGGPRSTWDTCWDESGRCWMLWTDGTPRRMYVPKCPHAPGERRWVRETWWPAFKRTPTNNGCVYRADYLKPTFLDPAIATEKVWTSSGRMPFWARRPNFTVETASVAAMQIQDVSEEDAKRMGLEMPPETERDQPCHWEELGEFWDSTHAKPEHKWAENPWACRTLLKKVEGE